MLCWQAAGVHLLLAVCSTRSMRVCMLCWQAAGVHLPACACLAGIWQVCTRCRCQTQPGDVSSRSLMASQQQA